MRTDTWAYGFCCKDTKQDQETIQYIMQRMNEWLDNRQMIAPQNALDESMKIPLYRWQY